jgi:hypothetical protein
MLTVAEVRGALEDANAEAIVFLPGGGHLRNIRVNGDHIYMAGDEDAFGTPEERKRFKDACALLAGTMGKPIDDPEIQTLARAMIDAIMPEPIEPIVLESSEV